jgi:hypothetical protein
MCGAVGHIAAGGLIGKRVDQPRVPRAQVVEMRDGLGLEALAGLRGVLCDELAHLRLGEGREGDVLRGDVEGRGAPQPGDGALPFAHDVVADGAHADEHHAPWRRALPPREVHRAELREEGHHRPATQHVGLVEEQHQRPVARSAERGEIGEQRLLGGLQQRRHVVA